MTADADQAHIDSAVAVLNAASSRFDSALLSFVSDCIRQYLTDGIDETEFWGTFTAEYDLKKQYWLAWQLKHPEPMAIVRAEYQLEFALLGSLLQIHEYRYYDRYFDTYYPDEWLDDLENAPEEIVEITLSKLLLLAVEKYATNQRCELHD